MPTRVLATFVDPMKMAVEAVTEAGNRTPMDGLVEDGGEEEAPTPKETLLASLAGCTAMDVAAILRKKRQAIGTYRVDVTAEMAERHPRVYTSIIVEHRLTGDVTEEAARRSVELSATRYCPVTAMLSGTVPIEHRYAINDGPSRLVVVTGPISPSASR